MQLESMSSGRRLLGAKKLKSPMSKILPNCNRDGFLYTMRRCLPYCAIFFEPVCVCLSEEMSAHVD